MPVSRTRFGLNTDCSCVGDASKSGQQISSKPGAAASTRGNISVSIGIYAAVLQALGLLDGLGGVADIAGDSVGQALSSAELPKRVRLKRRPAPPSQD